MFLGIAFATSRQKSGQQFRKSLGVYNHKIGHQQYHRKPGMINLHTKEQLREIGTDQAHRRIIQLEKENGKLLGEFVGQKFFFDKNKVPFYDVPDLKDFKLKPYVSYHTPRINLETKSKIKELNDFNKQENLIERTNIKQLM